MTECPETWEEEIGPTLHRRECWQARYFLSKRPSGYCHVKRAVLVPDDWIPLIAEFMKLRVVDPDVLRKLELSHEARTKHESGNASIDAVFGCAFR